MTTKLDPFDGTIEVRVVLHVKVDPKAWAENMMGDHPDEVRHKEIRDHVKTYIRDVASDARHNWAAHSEIDQVPITDVILEDPYRRS